MADASGEITLASSYTPWGDTLSVSGTGSVMQGYFGGMMDTATGLLYVGNGQYYDPATGRFLNRNARPDQTNPYVPWGGNPTSALMAPLFLLALIYSRKRKRGKLDTFVILLVLCLGVSMSLAACGPTVEATLTATRSPIPSPSPTATATVAVAGTSVATIPAVATTPSGTPTPTCTMTFTPTPPIPTPIGDRFDKIYANLMDPLYQDHWWRKLDDGVEMVLAVLSYLELRGASTGFIGAATEALAHRYWYACPSGCAITNGIPDGGMRWIMLFSYSLMQMANGISADLDQSTIDPAFAVSMARSVAEHPVAKDWSRPWGWFNTQSYEEFKYFNQKAPLDLDHMGDTDPYHVYWMFPENQPRENPVDIILTKYQYDTLCPSPTNSVPAYVKCGN